MRIFIFQAADAHSDIGLIKIHVFQFTVEYRASTCHNKDGGVQSTWQQREEPELSVNMSVNREGHSNGRQGKSCSQE